MARPDMTITVDAEEAVDNLTRVTEALRAAADAHTRSGYKTTEFWVAALVVVAALCTALSDWLPAGSPSASAVMRVGALAAAALTASGYAVSRAMAKRSPALPIAASSGETPATERPTPHSIPVQP